MVRKGKVDAPYPADVASKDNRGLVVRSLGSEL